jgi:hypothetical protein
VARERIDTAREPDQRKYAERRQDKKSEQHDGIRGEGLPLV